MAGEMLPPEYQALIDELLRKRALSSSLGTAAIMGKPTEMVSGRAVRQGGLGGLAQALTGYLGQSQANEATRGIAGVQTKYADDTQRELQGLMGNPDIKAAIAAGLASKNPRVVAHTLEQQKRRAEAARAAADAAKATDAQAAVRMAATGDVPVDYTTPDPGQPTLQSIGGEKVLVVPKANNQNEAKFPPKGTTVSVGAAKNYNQIVDEWQGSLKEKKEAANSARTILGVNQRAIEALQDGADTGGITNIEQMVRKLGQQFGLADAMTAPTEKLSMSLGQQILDNARKLAPVTAVDLEQLKGMLGSINTDPKALVDMLAYTSAIATKGLSDYQKFLGSRRESIAGTQDPDLRDQMNALISGQEIGLETPGQLSGPMSFQVETARQLQKLGFDLNQIQNMSPQMRKDLANPDMRVDMGGSFPALNRPGARPKVTEKPANMPQKDWDRLQELRKLTGQ